MDTAVEPNICQILSDGNVVGTGCLIRTQEDQKSTTLKVATSKKLFQNYPNGKLVASFRNLYGKPWNLELGSDLDKDYMNREIAVVPVEKPSSQLKETANLEGVPLINQNNIDEERIFSNAFVVKKSSSTQKLQIYKFWFKTEDCLMDSGYTEEPVLIESLKRCASYGLAVQGAPVISQNSKFLGIVDFSNKDGPPFFLPFLQFMSQSDLPKPTQETQKSATAKEDDRLLPDDNLETLWENQNFIYDLCKALDPVHSPRSKLKDHRNLAMEFPIPADTRKKIAGSEISPSENLFKCLESIYPNLLIKHLCDRLTLAKNAPQSLRTIQSAIKVGEICQSDYVSDLENKNHALKGKLILQLDYNDSWKGLSKAFEISERKCSTFLRDPKFNPTRTFFDILRTQSPRLKVSKLKIFLGDLGENSFLEELKSIPEKNFLKDLPSEAELMCDVIEPKLNATHNNLLYKLAEKFQKQGYISDDVDILDFQASECPESSGSPTNKLIDYVLTSLEKEYKIQDLKNGLANIGRADCIHILAKYVKGFDDELEKNEQKERDDRKQLQTFNRASLPVERAISVIDENQNENSADLNQGAAGFGMGGSGMPPDDMRSRGPTRPSHTYSSCPPFMASSLHDSGTDFGGDQEQGSEITTRDTESLDLSVHTKSQEPLKERQAEGIDPIVDQRNLRGSQAEKLRNPRPLDSGFVDDPQPQERVQSLAQGGSPRGQNDTALGGPGGPPLSSIASGSSCASDIPEQDQE